jgi:hypothetical protein
MSTSRMQKDGRNVHEMKCPPEKQIYLINHEIMKIYAIEIRDCKMRRSKIHSRRAV